MLTNVAFLSAATLKCGQDMSVKGLLFVYQVRSVGHVDSVVRRFLGLAGTAMCGNTATIFLISCAIGMM